MAPPAASGVIIQVSPFQPRSLICATATAIPALIFSALKPGGREGSEKSTVSGFWPTNRIRIMQFLHADSDPGLARYKDGAPGLRRSLAHKMPIGMRRTRSTRCTVAQFQSPRIGCHL